jgi:small-conductance mechanosensitive channel/CRP-like cAMP-binding protein
VPGTLPWIAVALFVVSVALWKRLPQSRSRFRSTFGFLGIWLLLSTFGAAGNYWHFDVNLAREIERAVLALAVIQVVIGVAFDLAVSRMGIPHFMTEVVVIVAYIGVLVNIFVRLGVNITGIFATSAVVTAVIGLSLQDTLGNMASFIALQFEDEIQPGDYIQCPEGSGWVQYVRLRHTALKTADGDRVLLPNSALTRAPVTILSRSRRTFIPFSMAYTANPQEVVDAVTAALNASPIPNVAVDPRPSCLILELAPAHVKYAAVVWLLKAGMEPASTSAILNRLYFSLRRAGIPIAELSQLLEVKTISEDRAERRMNPVDLLRQTPIFRQLNEPELFELSTQLRFLSFAPGERIIRQGDSADSMYLITAGQVAITYVAHNGAEQPIAVLGPGDFFGETALLTGDPRNTDAIAASRVDCYELDKSGLEGIIEGRPELIEDMAVVMTYRQEELGRISAEFHAEIERLETAEGQRDLLTRIRRFFGVDSDKISRV